MRFKITTVHLVKPSNVITRSDTLPSMTNSTHVPAGTTLKPVTTADDRSVSLVLQPFCPVKISTPSQTRSTKPSVVTNLFVRWIEKPSMRPCSKISWINNLVPILNL